jgi:hypothetical protein
MHTVPVGHVREPSPWCCDRQALTHAPALHTSAPEHCPSKLHAVHVPASLHTGALDGQSELDAHWSHTPADVHVENPLGQSAAVVHCSLQLWFTHLPCAQSESALHSTHDIPGWRLSPADGDVLELRSATVPDAEVEAHIKPLGQEHVDGAAPPFRCV